jgi:NADPH:quinone reductase-like Zn-dependent oxidoreductase
MVAATAILRAGASVSGAASNGLINSLFSVEGKNVLITGGSRGIGLMIAKNFVAAGANVLLTSRSEDACKEAAASIVPPPQYVVSNVSNRAGCEALAEHASKVFDNKLDVLINNAGASWGEPLDRVSGRANWGFDKVLDLVRRRSVASANGVQYNRLLDSTDWTNHSMPWNTLSRYLFIAYPIVFLPFCLGSSIHSY